VGSPPSGSGGTRPEGTGAGESGREAEGQVPIPLNTPDPRYADYFLQIKRQIEAHWVYPSDAVRKRQSGQGLLEFGVRKDGSLRLVKIVQSSGFEILDRYIANAVRLAAPFPPIPDRIGRESLWIGPLPFTYVLDSGVRVFGLR
jgi:TonB family protein